MTAQTYPRVISQFGNVEVILVQQNTMRILEHVPNRLVIRHYPIGSWVTGGVVSTLGLGLIIFSAQQPIATTLHCGRIQPDFVTCHLHRSTWIGMKTQQTIADVKSVEIAERRVKSGTQPYLILFTQAEGVEISNSQNEVSNLAEIQAFLGNAQSTTLTLHYHQSAVIFVFLIIAIVYSGMAFYFLMMPIVTCTIYRSLHKVVIEQQVWSRTRTSEYPLNAIYQVEVEEIRQKNGKSYRIVLWLKEKGRLPLTKDSSNRCQRATEIADSIRDFLQLAP